jgi:hypothetical protein
VPESGVYLIFGLHGSLAVQDALLIEILFVCLSLRLGEVEGSEFQVMSFGFRVEGLKLRV